MEKVYIAKWGAFYKIGFTKNMDVRLKGDSSAFRPAEEVEIIGHYEVERGKKVEGFVHKVLKEDKAEFGKEWFSISERQFHAAVGYARHKLKIECKWVTCKIKVRVGTQRLFRL